MTDTAWQFDNDISTDRIIATLFDFQMPKYATNMYLSSYNVSAYFTSFVCDKI